MTRLATDVGGTFTDLVLYDDSTGAIQTAKSLTTPKDQAQGVVNAIRESGLDPTRVDYFIHGGTTVINAITERKGVTTALVTTAGFRDVLEIGRGNRPDLYNLQFRSPTPLVPRRRRFEIAERIGADGSVIEPFTPDKLAPIIDACRAAQVRAIAICFLHSYLNPEHETQCATALADALPDAAISVSSEITREWREFERTNTAVLNAYVQPIIARYFEHLEAALRQVGLNCPLHAMQSNGGTTAFSWAKSHPVTLVESGPAGGVNGAALVGQACGIDDVISFDVGGTTAKCSLIIGGIPTVNTEYQLERSRLSPGYPVKAPVVDIVEVGAGGGSIAHMDNHGRLRVGPESAGAEPGPACYGRGGHQATVTDAKLIAGVLNAESFSSGQLALNLEAARDAFSPIADALKTDLRGAATAVIRIAEANMINALRLISVQRGHDPRDFALLASGGGGAMHAATLGRDLGVREVIVPRYPGLFSAWGMLATAPRYDLARTVPMAAADTDTRQITAIFGDMKATAARYFDTSCDALSYAARIEMRYHGQEHTVAAAVDVDRVAMPDLLERFHAAHERAYTFRLPEARVELIHFHLVAERPAPRPDLAPLDGAGRALDAARRPSRAVAFGDAGVHESMIYDRDLLPPDITLNGPLVIEEATATTVVLPGQRLWVDPLGLLRIREQT